MSETKNVTIPEAAVEAATKAFGSGCRVLRTEALDFERQVQDSLALMKALEAAAPHIAAKAWEKGREAGMLDYYHSENPYR